MPRDVDFDAFARAFPGTVLGLVGIRSRGHPRVFSERLMEKDKVVRKLMASARREQLEASLLTVLEARFDRVPRALRSAVGRATDVRLEAALAKAATAETPAQVERALVGRVARSRAKPLRK